MKKYYFIKKREINDYLFNGCYIFESEKTNRNFIMTTDGTSMTIDNDILRKLKKFDIDEEFMLKLIQRGFIKYKNSREIINKYDSIKPTFFLIDITECCNLDCIYCFRKLKKLSMNEKKAIEICEYIKEYCYKYDIKKICIQPWGGEPLLQFELIKKIQDFFVSTDINVKMIIETNATLINKKIAKDLYKRNFGIGVSIDGNEELHNKQRYFLNKSGSYNKVIKGIENLNSVGYNGKIGAISVITKNNYKQVDKILEHFVYDLNLRNIKFNIVRTNNRKIVLSEDEIKEFVSKMFESAIKLIKKDDINLKISDICDRIDNLLYRANNSICMSCGCLSGRKMISFNKNGEIFPCEMTDFKKEKIGDIEENKDLIDIIKESFNISELYKDEKVKNCETCPWWYYCKGGCKASKIYKYYFAKKIDKHECIYNKAIYSKIIDIWLREPEIINKMIRRKTNG